MCLKRFFQSLIVFILIAFLFSSVAWTQTRRHDLSLSCGIVTLDQISDMLVDVLTVVITFGTFSKNNMEFSVTPFLTYRYSPIDRIGVGFAVGGYTCKGELSYMGDKDGTFKETNYVGACEFDFHWIHKDRFQLYSGAGLGLRNRRGSYTVNGDEDVVSNVLPTFHINVIGFKFGKQIGFFGELGVGYKGVCNFGLSAMF